MKRSRLAAREELLNPGDEVSISVGLTLQVQERNFIKLDVQARTKVRPKETGDQALDRVIEFCEERLNSKAQEYQDSFR